jgi:hypothetical protein
MWLIPRSWSKTLNSNRVNLRIIVCNKLFEYFRLCFLSIVQCCRDSPWHHLRGLTWRASRFTLPSVLCDVGTGKEYNWLQFHGSPVVDSYSRWKGETIWDQEKVYKPKKYGYGSRRGPIPRMTVLASASSNLIQDFRHFIRPLNQLGLRHFMNVMEKTQILPFREHNSSLPAHRYTHWAIPTPTGLVPAFNPESGGWCKRAGTWNRSLTESSIDVMNVWGYNFTTSLVFMVFFLLSTGENFWSLNKCLCITLCRLHSLFFRCNAYFYLRLEKYRRG